jgi:hypothetical protein
MDRGDISEMRRMRKIEMYSKKLQRKYYSGGLGFLIGGCY